MIVGGFSFMPIFIAAALFTGPAKAIGSFGRKGVRLTISAIFLPIPVTVSVYMAFVTYMTTPTLDQVTMLFDGFILVFVMLFGLWVGLKATVVGGKVASGIGSAAGVAIAVGGGYAAGAGMIAGSEGDAKEGVKRAGRTGGKMAVNKLSGKTAAREVFDQAPERGDDDERPQTVNEQVSDTPGDGEKSAATEQAQENGGQSSSRSPSGSGGAGTQIQSIQTEVATGAGEIDQGQLAKESATLKDAHKTELSTLQPDPTQDNVNADVMEAWGDLDGKAGEELQEATVNAGDVSAQHMEYDELASQQQEALKAVDINRREYAEKRLQTDSIEDTYGGLDPDKNDGDYIDADGARQDLQTAYGSEENAPEALVNTVDRAEELNRAKQQYESPDGSGQLTQNAEMFANVTGQPADFQTDSAQLGEEHLDAYAQNYDRVMGLGHYTDPDQADADLLDPEDHPEAAKTYHKALQHTEGHHDPPAASQASNLTLNPAKQNDHRTTRSDARNAIGGENSSTNMKAHTTMLDGTGQALNGDEIADLYEQTPGTPVSLRSVNSNPHPEDLNGNPKTSFVSPSGQMQDAFDMLDAEANPYADNVSDDVQKKYNKQFADGNRTAEEIPNGRGGGVETDMERAIELMKGETSTLETDEHDETGGDGSLF